MDNLPELRDIHLPQETIPLFPPANGWWVLLLLIIATVVLFKLIIFIRRTSAKIYARKLLKALQEYNDVSAIIKMSEILRRACVRRYPEAVALFGKEWIDFLNGKSKNRLDEQAAELLINAPFMKENSQLYTPQKQQLLWQFCYEWIGENL